MPHEVLGRVNEFGKKQKMPNTLTFANHHRNEIQDVLDQAGDWNDEDDDSYPLEDVLMCSLSSFQTD